MHILDANKIFWMTFYTFDRIVEYGGKNGPDAVALYIKYIEQSVIQETNQILNKNIFMMNLLGWGKGRFTNAKRILQELGLIETVQIKGQNGNPLKKYIKVNF